MKKTTIILLLLLLTLVLTAACGGGAATPPQNGGLNEGGGAPVAPETSAEQGAPAVSESKEEEGGAETPAEPGEDLAAAYIDMLSSGSYYIKYHVDMGMADQKLSLFTEMAISGADMAIKTSIEGMESAVIFKDGDTYAVDHLNKSVMVSQGGTASLGESTLPQSGYTYKGSGTAELAGVSHKYEDYGTAAGDVRFFFEGGELIGLEAALEGLTVQMNILELSGTIPSGMFDIPADYNVGYTQI